MRTRPLLAGLGAGLLLATAVATVPAAPAAADGYESFNHPEVLTAQNVDTGFGTSMVYPKPNGDDSFDCASVPADLLWDGTVRLTVAPRGQGVHACIAMFLVPGHQSWITSGRHTLEVRVDADAAPWASDQVTVDRLPAATKSVRPHPSVPPTAATGAPQAGASPDVSPPAPSSPATGAPTAAVVAPAGAGGSGSGPSAAAWLLAAGGGGVAVLVAALLAVVLLRRRRTPDDQPTQVLPVVPADAGYHPS